MDLITLIVGLLLGALLGATISYFIVKSRTAVLQERLRSQDEKINEQNLVIEDAKQSIQAAVTEGTELKNKLTEADTRLEGERKAFAEKEKVFKELENRFSDTFKALSGNALKENAKSFLQLAKETLSKEQIESKGDLEKKKQAIEAMLKPINDSLKHFGEKVSDIEKARVGAYESLKDQVVELAKGQTMLRGETGNLVKALGTPRVRGKWGEIQLRTVVEMAGMTEHCDFEEQQSRDREDGTRARPDMIIKLPGKKQVIVDAKAPMEGFLSAIEADSREEREALMKDHARHIRMHIKDLSAKEYWAQFDDTPEFVVLFLPGESFFSAALEVEPNLIDEGIQNKVILATPTTLIALLKVVAYGWRQESLAVQAQEISTLGKQIYERVADVATNWAAVGKGLKNAVEHYNKAVHNLESKVLVSARKFKDLPIELSNKEIKTSESLDVTTRKLQSPELEGK